MTKGRIVALEWDGLGRIRRTVRLGTISGGRVVAAPAPGVLAASRPR